jgi:phosphoribosylformimino-5-aminoimidazole carboxamide ribotide isomerase
MSATLEIIPAIDLMNGQAVRLRKGDFETKERVAEDPIEVAQGFERAGATRIHIVDLDGAKTGSPQNHETIKQILRAVNIPVQVGGGLRSLERVREILALGADRAVVGTSAAKNPEVIAEILAAEGERIIVGADAMNGFIASHGWQEATTERVEDFGRRMVTLGGVRFLFTDISRDGMLEGVNDEATVQLAQAIGKPVIASGGVADIEDIKKLTRVQPLGVEGVVIGKALYAGRLDLAEALSVALTYAKGN